MITCEQKNINSHFFKRLNSLYYIISDKMMQMGNMFNFKTQWGTEI